MNEKIQSQYTPDVLYEVRMLILLETEPSSGIFGQIELKKEQFKEMSLFLMKFCDEEPNGMFGVPIKDDFQVEIKEEGIASCYE